ncbi:MAG: formate dehydrogenase subunit alpha [Thermoleophilia bacterium]
MNLTIDGRRVVAELGTTILQAARAAGIQIPTLCQDDRLDPISACRLCVVAVEGRKDPVTACDTQVAEGLVVTTQTEELRAIRQLNLELMLSDHTSFCTPPCRDACPTHIKIPQFLGHIAAREYEAGMRALREDLPFPGILGRVCPRPCEGPCRRQLVEAPITICQLHRFMSDETRPAEQEGELLLPAEPRSASGKRVAIVGGGPAGLAAAFYARLEGHAVKIFEAMPHVGGMLRYGIPAYRLPRDIIDAEVNILWRMGVELQTGVRLGVDVKLDELRAEYDAVFLALGAFNANAMGCEGEDADGVVTAIDFLGDLERDGEVHTGEKVTVIGGGFTAMDACRTAVRLGAKEVTCLYRRSRTEMPAHHSEVDEAEEEGVRLVLQVAPLRVLTDEAGRVSGIEMIRMELGEPDASGRRRPVPIEGSEFVVECDQVISAIGQFPKLDGAGEAEGLAHTKWRTLAVDDWTLQTRDPKVFAGGDAVLGAQTVIQAIAQGKKAAWSMDAYLRGDDMQEVSRQLHDLRRTPFVEALSAKSEIDPRVRRMAEVPPVFIDINAGVIEASPSAHMPKLHPDERRTNFAQIELGFAEDDAVRGADLCLQCSCDANGACELQRQSIDHGVFANRFQGAEARGYDAREDTPFIAYDPNRCILCGRCVSVCKEVQQCNVLDFAERGFDSLISTSFGRSMVETDCEMCGNCVSACPTGALLDKLSRVKAKAGATTAVETVCPFCGCGCTIQLRVRDGRVVQVSSEVGVGSGEGNLCVKGRYGFQFIGHPERLTQPLVRRDGEFVPASWDEALDLVAERLSAIKAEHGPDALAGFSSARCTNEDNYVFQKFMRAVIGTQSVDHCARLCHASTVTGLRQSLGSGAMTNSFVDIEEADAILIVGSNTSEAHPIAALHIKQALRRGAKMIVIDPRRIDMARRADIHLQLLPGTNVAVLNGLMNVILQEGMADEEFIAARTEGFEALPEVLAAYTPELVEQVSGVPADKLREAARVFASAARGAIFYSMGITQHSHGTEHVLAISNLALLSGNLGRRGVGVNPLRGQNNVQGACDMGALPDVYTGYQAVGDPNAQRRFSEAWGVELPDKPGLTVTEAFDAMAAGAVKGLFIVGENPMLSDPDQHHVEEALRGLDFLVVQDIFLSETAQLADVVLPAASFAEKDGTFTNTERKVQRVRAAVPSPGQARADWEIITDLARRLGGAGGWDYSHPREILAEISALTPSYAGITFERLDAEGGLCWPCPDTTHPGTPILHIGQFTRGRGKFFPIAYQPPAEEAGDEYPLTLTTGRLLEHYHTGTMTRRSDGLNELVPTGFVEINPEDAARLGVHDGVSVTVETRRGSIDVPANVTPRVRTGTVFVPFHFWESPANRLTNAARDPMANIPEFKVCACRVSS